MKWKLMLAAALLLLVCGCTAQPDSPAESQPSAVLPAETADSAVEKSSSLEDSSWTPYYTGGDRAWDQAEPWASGTSGDNSEAQSAWSELYYRISGRTDYGGCYSNCSGTLTVLVVNPTEETAAEYAANSETGFWIIAAEYSHQELTDTMDALRDEISAWLDETPDAYLQLNAYYLDECSNRVIFHLCGPSLQPLTDALEIPGSVTLTLYQTALASDADEIPWEPETVWEDSESGIRVSVAQASYPVGTESVAVILENTGDGVAMYGEFFSIEKYIDGQWQNVSGNMSFNAVGYSLESHDRRVLELNTSGFLTPLGPGLYRITGDNIRWGPADSDLSGSSVHRDLEPYVVEFTVTEDAPEPLDTAELEAVRTEGQWYTPSELADPWFALTEGGRCRTLDGPYMAVYWQEDAQTRLVACDRSTGDTLTAEPLAFDADAYSDVMVLRDGSVMVRTPDTVWCLWVEDGALRQTDGATFPDTDIPYDPVSQAESLDGSISAAMEQAVYPSGAQTVTYAITNNTGQDITFSYYPPLQSLYRVDYSEGLLNCWYHQEDDTPVELLQSELTIAAGETLWLELSLDQWTQEDESGGETALGRGLYQIIFSHDGTASGQTEEETAVQVSFALEFALEG